MDGRNPASSPVWLSLATTGKNMPIWFKPRHYLHFDTPISKTDAKRIVESPQEISEHAFYPLISYEISSLKIGRDPISGQVIRKPLKKRQIQYASHVDAHVYSFYAERLSVLYETALAARQLQHSVLAFRRLGKSNIDFAKKAFDTVRNIGNCTVLAMDVTGFFDHIDHVLLKEAWATVLGESQLPSDHFAVYRSVTKSAYIDRDSLYDLLGISIHNPKFRRVRLCTPLQFRQVVRKSGLIQSNRNAYGIPQGTPISAVLSNLYLLNFDKVMSSAADECGGAYLRYCDDVLLIVPPASEIEIQDLANKEISKIKLVLNPKKTEISRFTAASGQLSCDRQMQYLGFIFDGKRILIRSAALARFSARLNQGVRLAKATAKSRNQTRQEKGLSTKPLYRRKLYERYSHLGSRNFIRYGLRAAEELQSKAIRKQLRPLWGRLKQAIEKQ